MDIWAQLRRCSFRSPSLMACSLTAAMTRGTAFTPAERNATWHSVRDQPWKMYTLRQLGINHNGGVVVACVCKPWKLKLNTLSNKEAMNTKNTNDTKNQEKEEY